MSNDNLMNERKKTKSTFLKHEIGKTGHRSSVTISGGLSSPSSFFPGTNSRHIVKNRLEKPVRRLRNRNVRLQIQPTIRDGEKSWTSAMSVIFQFSEHTFYLLRFVNLPPIMNEFSHHSFSEGRDVINMRENSKTETKPKHPKTTLSK